MAVPVFLCPPFTFLPLQIIAFPSKFRGYVFKPRQVSLHDLSYADDLTFITNSIRNNQQSLDDLNRFLVWSRTMEAKASKCKSLAFKYWNSRDEQKGLKPLVPKSFPPFDPKLTIGGEPIEFIGNDSFRFLGWNLYHNMKEINQKREVEKLFLKNLNLVSDSSVHGFMKLWLYQHYVLIYLAWPFLIYDFDMSWAKSLEAVATRKLKLWSGLYRSALTSTLYRSRADFGLGLTSVSAFYRKMQLSRMHLLKHSADENLKALYLETHARQSQAKRIWQPSVILENLESRVTFEQKFAGQLDRKGLGFVPDRYSKSLTLSQHKEKVMEKLSQEIRSDFVAHDLDKALQGLWIRLEDVQPFDFSWSHLINTRNPRLVTWVLNASVNSVVSPYLRTCYVYPL